MLYFHPIWFKRHFYDFDKTTVNNTLYQCICGTLFGFYVWELSLNKYGRLETSIVIHHWATIIAAISILLGAYIPWATWFGMTGVQLQIPSMLAFGFRTLMAKQSKKYANMVSLFMFVAYFWTIFVTILNLSGQLYIIIYGLYSKKLFIYQAIIICFTMPMWLYDDYLLLIALKRCYKMEYYLIVQFTHIYGKILKNYNAKAISLYNNSINNHNNNNNQREVILPWVGHVRSQSARSVESLKSGSPRSPSLTPKLSPRLSMGDITLNLELPELRSNQSSNISQLSRSSSPGSTVRFHFQSKSIYIPN